MITARPIRFTSDIAAHRRILEALGATRVTESDGWIGYAVGSGRLALHDAAGSDRSSGTTVLGWEVDDLDAWAQRAGAAGVSVTVGETDHGLAATVIAPDGTTFTVDPAAEALTPPPADRRVSVLPIWVTDQVQAARDVLLGIGAVARLVADSEVWSDFSCDGGGLAAVHRAEQGAEPAADVELAFEYDGDVEELVPVLQAAGVAAILIDETYSRTLQVANPDRQGSTIWINQRQADLYGYRNVG